MLYERQRVDDNPRQLTTFFQLYWKLYGRKFLHLPDCGDFDRDPE
jgi:hypothetical protein